MSMKYLSSDHRTGSLCDPDARDEMNVEVAAFPLAECWPTLVEDGLFHPADEAWLLVVVNADTAYPFAGDVTTRPEMAAKVEGVVSLMSVGQYDRVCFAPGVLHTTHTIEVVKGCGFGYDKVARASLTTRMAATKVLAKFVSDRRLAEQPGGGSGLMFLDADGLLRTMVLDDSEWHQRPDAQ